MTRDEVDFELEGALLLLAKYRIPFRQPTPAHLKIGPINYFPSTGRVYRDGAACSAPGRGLSALERSLREAGLIPPLQAAKATRPQLQLVK